MRLSILLLAGLTCALAAAAHADTLYVNGSCGNDDWTGTSSVCSAPNGPKRNIQAGIDTSVTGDTVIVADGTYTGSGNRDLDFGGRDIHLRSESLNPALCIIDCQASENDQHRGLTFQSGESPAARIEGFTIRGAYIVNLGGILNGAGILCLASSPTIARCVLTNNTTTGSRTHVAIDGDRASILTIIDCVIAANEVMSQFSSSAFAVYSIGGLTMTGTTVRDNVGCGGAFAGQSVVTDCQILRNTNGGDGVAGVGGITLAGPNSVLARSEIVGNFGGGAATGGVRVSGRVEDCLIALNHSDRGVGGILAQGTVERCTIIDNSGQAGGGVGLASIGVVRNCFIAGNSATYRGGGVFLDGGSVFNCLIVNNTSDGDAGGVWCFDETGTVANCLIAGNSSAGDGGGIVTSDGIHVIANCTVVFNQAAGRGGGIVGKNRFSNGLGPTVYNSIIWGNSAVAGPQLAVLDFDDGLGRMWSAVMSVGYSDAQGGEASVVVDPLSTLNWGAGNIDANPLFVDPGNGDYHISGGSPCVDVGDPEFEPQPGEADIDGQVRVWNGRVDMGADEWGSFFTGDVNCDGAINAFDIEPFLLALFDPDEYAIQFPDCDISLADINGDGSVNSFDIEPFLELLFS